MTIPRVRYGVLVFGALLLLGTSGQAQSPWNKLKKAVDKAKQVTGAAQTAAPGQPAANSQPSAGETPAAAPAGGTAAAATNTASASSGGAAVSQPGHAADTGASLLFTKPMYDLMTLRDIPQFFTDDHLAPFAAAQIGSEQTKWRELGPKPGAQGGTQAAPPQITYEWQKLVDQEPDFANSQLIDVFLRTNPDWSFLDKAKGWDPNASQNARPVVDVFVFAKEKIVGRQPEFAAHELVPVMKRNLEAAIKRLPTHFYFTERLPDYWKYDFGAKAIKFQVPPPQDPNRINLLLPIWDPDTKFGSKEMFAGFPQKAQTTGLYAMGAVIEHTTPPQVNPGRQTGGESPEWGWKNRLGAGTIAEPSAVSFDRRLQISGIPLDPARAEAVTKAGGSLTVRVYFTADHIELQHPATVFDIQTRTMMFARFEKAEFLARNGEVIAVMGPDAFAAAH